MKRTTKILNEKFKNTKIASNTKKILYNHLLVEENILKNCVFFLLFITYPNVTKFGDKKVLPHLMGRRVDVFL